MNIQNRRIDAVALQLLTRRGWHASRPRRICICDTRHSALGIRQQQQQQGESRYTENGLRGKSSTKLGQRVPNEIFEMPPLRCVTLRCVALRCVALVENERSQSKFWFQTTRRDATYDDGRVFVFRNEKNAAARVSRLGRQREWRPCSVRCAMCEGEPQVRCGARSNVKCIWAGYLPPSSANNEHSETNAAVPIADQAADRCAPEGDPLATSRIRRAACRREDDSDGRAGWLADGQAGRRAGGRAGRQAGRRGTAATSGRREGQRTNERAASGSRLDCSQRAVLDATRSVPPPTRRDATRRALSDATQRDGLRRRLRRRRRRANRTAPHRISCSRHTLPFTFSILTPRSTAADPSVNSSVLRRRRRRTCRHRRQLSIE
ncbi:hypothetical protein V9T40_007471 [Parthenolecanium corni]|uniref:Uncharacterized protein n=1 Tax=Parthenolecanium corni TaxID=536013 RepID=A0AAN9Y479_9HEMI